MFPTVMLIVNISSVAVLWFGGHRIDSGHMQVGALTAFLSYLMQILMSIMMATFMFVMIPRAEVCAERIEEVLGHRLQRGAAAPRRSPNCAGTAMLELRDVEFQYPGAEAPVLRGVNLHGPAAARSPRSSAAPAAARPRCSTWSRGCSTRPAATVLVDGVDVRDLDPADAVAAVGRPRAAEAVPVHRHDRQPTCATATRTPPTTNCGEALEVAQARELRRADGRRPGRADRPGRHQRLRRSAAAAGDRPRAGAQAGDLPVRRLVLGPRLRHRRGAAGRADRRTSPTRRW